MAAHNVGHVSMIMQWNAVKAGELAAMTAMDGDELVGWMEENIGDTVDVDKAWQGIHAVLTGTAYPEGHELDGLIFGGTPFGPELSYGPPRYLTADEVAAVASLVEQIPVEDFEARIDLGLLARLDIYPQIWGRESEAEINVRYLSDGYSHLRSAFLAARTAGNAMITWMA